MNYRLNWIEHWSEKHESADPRVPVRHNEVEPNWYEHECFYYFDAISENEAKDKAKLFMKEYPIGIDVFSLYNRKTKQVILTEEEA